MGRFIVLGLAVLIGLSFIIKFQAYRAIQQPVDRVLARLQVFIGFLLIEFILFYSYIDSVLDFSALFAIVVLFIVYGAIYLFQVKRRKCPEYQERGQLERVLSVIKMVIFSALLQASLY